MGAFRFLASEAKRRNAGSRQSLLEFCDDVRDSPGSRLTKETVIGLSFSGGGTRASAFAYGAIEALAAHETRSGGIGKSLIDDGVTLKIERNWQLVRHSMSASTDNH